MSVISSSVQRFAGARTASVASPAVSIVLPVYDPPLDVLRRQLEAIAEQTSGDWECIVVDDASTDDAVRTLLTAWTSVDERRHLVLRDENGGIAAATNDGIDRAAGAAITFCDHDDVIHAGAVEAIADHFAEHAEHDVVYTDEQLIDADGTFLADYRKPDYSPRRHLGHHYLAHLVAGRRTTIADLRVRREFEPSQDYDFWLRVIERAMRTGGGVGHIAQCLYSWRAISGSSALDAAEKPEMALAVQRCVHDALVRRGIDATATVIEHDGHATTSLRVEYESVDGPSSRVDYVTFDDTTTTAELNERIARGDGDLICLVPSDAPAADSWAHSLIDDARRDDVGVVGPLIVGCDPNGDEVLISVGRTVAPALADQFSGARLDSPGPWGAFFVSREVSAVAPHGAMVERRLYDSVGGLSDDVGLHVAVAELCRRLDERGAATLVLPAAKLHLRTGELPLPELDVADLELARVEVRVRSVRQERFALSGIPAQVDLEPTPYRAARRAIASGTVGLVTSDVFDTVVTRPVATPSDLFVVLGARLADEGSIAHHVTPAIFAEARRSAERRARADIADVARRTLLAEGLAPDDVELDPRVRAPECTMEEIWQHMPSSWITSDAATGLIQRELEVEAEFLRPIAEVLDLFRFASERGIPIVLVSDIYMSARELSDVLAGAGVDLDLVDEVVTSADHRLSKHDGLLERVIGDRGASPATVLHIGDHEISDVQTARRLGAVPIHVEVPAGNRHVRIPHPALRAWSTAEGTDLGISAAVRSTLLAGGALGRDPSYQFGAAVVGPALAGFATWVSATAADHGASTVHCMLREGATIAELMTKLRPDGPLPVPLHVSRWVTMRAAVVDATPDELYAALARRSELTAAHLVAAFDVDPALAREVVGDEPVGPADLVEMIECVADHDRLRGQILESAAELRSRVLRHLRATLVLDDGPIVLSDVGWGGTIQEGLERILRSDGIGNDVLGLYLAMAAAGEERARRGAWMASYLPNTFENPAVARLSRSIAHHADTIERIMTPELGTLVDITDAGVPVTRPVGDDPIPPTLEAAQVGMRRVIDRLADPTTGLGDMTDARWIDDAGLRSSFAEILADAVVTPSPPMAAALGAWPHDDVAGADHRSIAGGHLAAAVRYANARDLDLIDPTGRSWTEGLAGQHNPSLSAQLAADLAGVALDGLCPENENGMARLAAFEVGSDLAALQVGRAPGVSPAGWSVLRMTGPVTSLRSIRFDAGEHEALVDVAMLSVSFGTSGEFDPAPLDIDDLTAGSLVWVSAHPVDRRRFAHRPGGHLIIPIDGALANEVRSVEVTVAFRCWRLLPEATIGDAPVAQRLGSQGRRVVDGIKRRIPR